mmetsp:Transcript_25359/g.78974  ORF Transcript_25359/g.78974 Transcript_25359/m.78974 type:complete len:203 (-) Transcript_25359:565-1173(-)
MVAADPRVRGPLHRRQAVSPAGETDPDGAALGRCRCLPAIDPGGGDHGGSVGAAEPLQLRERPCNLDIHIVLHAARNLRPLGHAQPAAGGVRGPVLCAPRGLQPRQRLPPLGGRCPLRRGARAAAGAACGPGPGSGPRPAAGSLGAAAGGLRRRGAAGASLPPPRAPPARPADHGRPRDPGRVPHALLRHGSGRRLGAGACS